MVFKVRSSPPRAGFFAPIFRRPGTEHSSPFPKARRAAGFNLEYVMFSPEQIAEIRRIADEQIAAAGAVVDTGTDPADIIAGPDRLGAVQYRAMKGVNVFDPALLRNGTELSDVQRNNIAQNVGCDLDGNIGAIGPQTGRLVPESLKLHPELFWPDSREQRYGLLSFCREYAWDYGRNTWGQVGDVLTNYTAFRTEDTKTGVQLLIEHV